MSASLALAHRAAKLLPVSTFVHMLEEDDFGRPLPNLSPLFNSSSADLILSSCDSFHFKVHRAILSEASPIFNAALATLPEKSANDPPPIQDLAEDGDTISALLQFIYPVPNPVVTDLESIRLILSAAQKYEIPSALECIRQVLVSQANGPDGKPPLMEVDPLGVYSVACEFGLRDEAKLASRATLKLDVLSVPIDSPHLSRISGTDFLRLVRLHKTRAGGAVAVLDCMNPMPHGCCGYRDYISTPMAQPDVLFDEEGIPIHPPQLTPRSRNDGRHRSASSEGENTSGYVRWWATWKEAAIKELEARPTSNVIFESTYLMNHVKRASRHCQECPPTFMSSATQRWIAVLKERIDALPDTI